MGNIFVLPGREMQPLALQEENSTRGDYLQIKWWEDRTNHVVFVTLFILDNSRCEIRCSYRP
jgi:hypothetical protein